MCPDSIPSGRSQWRSAQAAEADYWAHQESTPPQTAARYRKISELMATYCVPLPTSWVLDVGGGPWGASLPGPAPMRGILEIDPLVGAAPPTPIERFQGDGTSSPPVSRVRAVGERLPVRSNGFELAFSVNCIDHASSPAAILNEVARVLREEGHFFLMVHCVPRMAALAHDAVRATRIDRRITKSSRIGATVRMVVAAFTGVVWGWDIFGDTNAHPHYLTPSGIHGLVRAAGLRVVASRVETSAWGYKDEMFLVATKSTRTSDKEDS